MTLTPEQKFLVAWTREGRMVTDVVRARCMPKHGERGLKRRAKKARLRAHRARLRRVSWCAYGEVEKRKAAAC